MSDREHLRHAEDPAPYVLGALPPDEAAGFERHAATCAECREEVERFRMAVEALARSVDPVPPPVRLRAAVMDAVGGEARRRRSSAGLRGWRGLARPLALASCLIALGAAGGLGYAELKGSADPRVLEVAVDRDRLPGASATLIVPDSRLEPSVLRAEGLKPPPSGRVYQVWLLRGDAVVPSSVFAVRSDGTGAVAIPQGLEGVDAVLVTRERQGGARAPSEQPVLRASL